MQKTIPLWIFLSVCVLLLLCAGTTTTLAVLYVRQGTELADANGRIRDAESKPDTELAEAERKLADQQQILDATGKGLSNLLQSSQSRIDKIEAIRYYIAVLEGKVDVDGVVYDGSGYSSSHDNILNNEVAK